MAGNWGTVLEMLPNMHISSSLKYETYQQTILELIHVKEYGVANSLLKYIKGALKLKIDSQLHWIESLISTPSTLITTEELAERRERLVSKYEKEMLPATPAASLLEAIGDSLRYKFLLSQRLKTPSLPSLPAHIGSHKFDLDYRVESAAFSNDGLCLFLGTKDGFIEAWDPFLMKPNQTGSPMILKDSYALSMVFHPISSYIFAAGSSNGEISVGPYRLMLDLEFIDKYANFDLQGV
ncbi:hypothetical protein DI09_21p40 [Mitosporidium daphniae]|uniref:Uncharacterized protein n=1 Tax=Mitosporidium daphniae TaxID=1485682 RepID=A0A098VSR2_9MICR|nr:uncharacterized protein DI09_21p40 [Mitosporidium daphniae]KGG52032.1 hypothetical protein DI09_21p40 [Mitosporidium daphniae]|eukprot:XP_013238489.1 uncharacterized protein DI09_21p40 [Mitosporidium daphniae]